MAIFRVWSGGDDADGASWATAIQSLNDVRIDESAVGSEIWAASDHNESIGSNIVLSFVNSTAAVSTILKSIDRSDDSYAPGAKFTASGVSDLTINGWIQSYGIDFQSGDNTTLGTTNNDQRYEDCTITAIDFFSLAGSESVLRFVNCTIDSQDTFTLAVTENTHAQFKNCTITHANRATLLTVVNNSRVSFEDCDLSSDTDNIVAGISNKNAAIIVRRCKMKASWTTLGAGAITVANSFILVEGSDDGTITLPELGLRQLDTHYGTVTSETAIYRTGGSDDGEHTNPISWKMLTNANALEQFKALDSPPITRWVNPDTTPSGATSRGTFTSTRMAIKGTPAALTTDGASTWNGAGVGTKQKITHTLDNQDGATLTVYVASAVTLNDDDFWIEVSEPDQVGGPITVRCFLAIPSTAVYIDPKLEVA